MCSRITFFLLFSIAFNSAIASSPKGIISDVALNNFIQELRASDYDRAAPDQLTLDFQRYADNRNLTDQANRKLFSYVSTDLLSKPLYKKFLVLLDNYTPSTGQREYETQEERREIDAFLDEVLKTAVFNKTYDFLRNHGHSSTWSHRHFKDSLKNLWFDYYSRMRGVQDTSAFEHVFVGEVLERNREIGGMHNWLRFYAAERDGAVDYAGYVVRRKNVALVMFRWLNLWKTTGSFMIGTSPAFDMAAYTLCFWLKPGFRSCHFNLDGCTIEVTSHAVTQNGKTFIGTSFPSPGRPSSTCR
jgi:poly(U)-specific endoribonuclease